RAFPEILKEYSLSKLVGRIDIARADQPSDRLERIKTRHHARKKPTSHKSMPRDNDEDKWQRQEAEDAGKLAQRLHEAREVEEADQKLREAEAAVLRAQAEEDERKKHETENEKKEPQSRPVAEINEEWLDEAAESRARQAKEAEDTRGDEIAKKEKRWRE